MATPVTKEPKVKTILISQPAPIDGKSPYDDLKEKYKVQVSFRSFTKVEAFTAKEFRREKISILDFGSIIFNSRVAIEHFFKLIVELRVDMPADMKYFCITEGLGLYLQKFITYRKRKVFYPKTKEVELNALFLKHKNDKFLIPCAEASQNDLTVFLRKNKIVCQEAYMYRTTSADLSDLSDVYFDIIAFFTPTGIKSLFENFPDFQQNNTRIAAFGQFTCQAVRDANLRLDVEAPTAQSPSMKMALEEYIKKVNK
ncbi:MAG: uroporphyrinogen-III synthase [Bacteroidetes bacterium]|nr:uroporphyrinogen-III synthase [Bacteroidota bacterium]